MILRSLPSPAGKLRYPANVSCLAGYLAGLEYPRESHRLLKFIWLQHPHLMAPLPIRTNQGETIQRGHGSQRSIQPLPAARIISSIIDHQKRRLSSHVLTTAEPARSVFPARPFIASAVKLYFPSLLRMLSAVFIFFLEGLTSSGLFPIAQDKQPPPALWHPEIAGRQGLFGIFVILTELG